MKITEPGIYRGISEADYRADPCPIPSLTQSLCKIALERSMRSVRTASPSLNPNFEPDDDTKFDLGNTAHTMILGRGKEFEVVDFDYWSPKAKLAREEAAAQGRIAVLRDQHTRAAAMAAEARAQLDRHEDRDAFTGGDAEVMIAWQEDGIWCRAGYGTRPMTPEYPAYQEKSWLERELSGEFENNNPDLIFAG
jgi:hypothetical protein